MLLFLPFIFPVILGGLGAGLASGAIVSLVCAIISGLCDENSIKKEIRARNEFKNAIKAIIKSKDVKKVSVGIFEQNETNLGTLEIKADGVSKSLHVGQVIYL